MWHYNPLEWGDYLNGKNLEGNCRPYRPGPDSYQRWVDLLERSSTAKEILKATESASEFFKVESDLNIVVPGEAKTEFFYSLKLGFCTPGVPAAFIYFAKKIYEQYEICNLVPPLLPSLVTKNLRSNGYFGNGYTALDALRSFCNPNYTIIDRDHLIVRCGDWYEAYLPICDMVCALPKSIGSNLRNEDVQRIHYVVGKGLCIGETPIARGRGITNVYDLRDPV